MKKIIFLIISTVVVFAQPNQWNEREAYLNLNSDTLEVGYSSEDISIKTTNSSTKFKYGFTGTNSSDISRVTASIKNENVIETLQGSRLGIGLEAVYLNKMTDEATTFLPLTASFRYNFPALMYNIPPVSIDTSISYAPNVLSFNSDIDSYRNISVEGNIEPIENVKLYIGYRDIKTKGNQTPDSQIDEGYFGIKMNF